jgi:hypothetical protein
MSEPFLFQGLTAGEAQSTAEAHRAKGATAEIVPGQGVLSRSKLCIPRQPVQARMWVRHRPVVKPKESRSMMSAVSMRVLTAVLLITTALVSSSAAPAKKPLTREELKMARECQRGNRVP